MNISNKKTQRNGQFTEINPIVYRACNPLELKGSFVGNTATVAVSIQHYIDEARTVKDEVFADSVISLLIDNSTIINSRTRQYADENTPDEFQIGEFDFF